MENRDLEKVPSQKKLLKEIGAFLAYKRQNPENTKINLEPVKLSANLRDITYRAAITGLSVSLAEILLGAIILGAGVLGDQSLLKDTGGSLIAGFGLAGSFSAVIGNLTRDIKK